MKEFSDRDRWGAFAYRKERGICEQRVRARRVLLLTVCLLGLAVFFASVYQPSPATSDSNAIYGRTHAPNSPSPGMSKGQVQLCSGGARRSPAVTCLVDGDTGWHAGKKWRLANVDTPELSSPGCPAEYQIALRAQRRLQQLMNAGHRIDWTGRTEFYGRHLVSIVLGDRRDAGDQLIAEGLAQAWPNRGNVWCEKSGPSSASRWAAQTRNWLRVMWSRVGGLFRDRKD